MAKDALYLTTDLGYDGYLRVTLNLPRMRDVNVVREKCTKGRFLFELEEIGFEGVKIQISSKGKLSIYFPRSAPGESIANRILEVLTEANENPVKIICEKRLDTFGMGNNHATLMNHSKKLVLGLEYLLFEDRAMWLAEKHSSAWSHKVSTKGSREKQYAEQHLRDNEYRTVRLELAAHRRLNQEIALEYERGKIPTPVFDAAIKAAGQVDEDLSEQEKKQLEEILTKKWDSYQKLALDVRFLEEKVKHGIPLKGKCGLCRN